MRKWAATSATVYSGSSGSKVAFSGEGGAGLGAFPRMDGSLGDSMRVPSGGKPGPAESAMRPRLPIRNMRIPIVAKPNSAVGCKKRSMSVADR